MIMNEGPEDYVKLLRVLWVVVYVKLTFMIIVAVWKNEISFYEINELIHGMIKSRCTIKRFYTILMKDILLRWITTIAALLGSW